MEVVENIRDVVLLEYKLIEDNRGWFSIPFPIHELKEFGFQEVCQINHSYTKEKGVIRGLNYQEAPYSQAKGVRCIRGSLYSVAVNMDKSSENYGKFVGYILSDSNHRMMYIPRNHAHGFITLEEDTELEYITDNIYSYPHAKSISYKGLGIDWTVGGMVSIQESIQSDKNKYAPELKDL